MTVMTEQQVEVPAWAVSQGDVVYSPSLDDWYEVTEVRHRNGSDASGERWTVTLTLRTGTDRDYYVLSSNAKVLVAVP